MSLNVGRAGISKSFMQLQRIFSSRPGVVMFQETWLKKSALSRFCTFARKVVPGYSVFAKSTTQDCSNDEILQGLDIRDKTERMEKALELALGTAEKILGVSKPRQASHIPFHSSAAKRLLSLRRDARAAITDLRSKTTASTESASKMSKAMRKAWDRQWIPPGLSYHMANQMSQHKEIG